MRNKDSFAELSAAIKQITGERDQLRVALRDVSQDMHISGIRPCGTCAAVTRALGEAFGCVAYQARLATKRVEEVG